MLSGIKRETRMRITIAWMLLVALMPLQIVKSLHYHESVVSSSCSHHGCHGDNDFQHSCPICNFTLSPFVHSETPQFTFVAELLSFVVPVYEKGKVFVLFHSCGLRAPPLVA
jgi:hypothetical protein